MRSICIVAVSLIALNASAGDWPCFAGPDRSGVSNETGLVDSFGEKGPTELWKIDVNEGYGGSAIFDGKVYVMDRKGNGKTDGTDIVMCLDLAKGDKIWSESYDAPGDVSYKGTRATPAVDKDVVVTVGPMGDVICWDRTKHSQMWKHNLLKDFGGKLPMWAVAQSPLILGDLVIVAPQTKTVGVVAYEKKTGNVKWQSKAIGRMSYQSPLRASMDKVEQIVMGSSDAVTGLDAANGNILWTYDKWKCQIPIATPTDLGDGRFFITGAYNAGCAMIKVSHEDGKWTVKEEFKNDDVECWMHNALYFDKHIYANSAKNGKGLMCLTADDTIKWRTMTEKKGRGFDIGGAMLIADKKIFIMNGSNGTLSLVEASPAGFKELAQAKVLDGKERVWAPMSLSDGKLIVRDQTTLKCLDVKAKK